MSMFRVDTDTLRRAAHEHHAISRRLTEIETQRTSANLPHGALGRLPESDRIQESFDARYQGLGEALRALQEIYDNIGDGLIATSDGYTASDAGVVGLLNILARQA